MTDLNDLRYHIPPDVLHYEPRFIFGLSATDLVVAAFPAILVMNAFGIVPGIIAVVAILSLLKRFDHFGNRSFPVYYFQRWQYTRSNPQVHIPLILPPEAGALQVETWDGDKLFSIEDEK